MVKIGILFINLFSVSCRLSPPEIAANLPTLLTTVRSVFQTSRFYNTSDQITGFLAKVTNQIIISCQNFLTNYGESSIWRQKQEEVLVKIDVKSRFDRKMESFCNGFFFVPAR
jgi:dynein heavy chain, axonemal